MDIVTKKGYGAPDTKDEVFEILKDKELISQAEFESYKKLQDQRNIIEFQYLAIDKKNIYQVATKNITDVKKLILFAEEYYC